MSESAETKKASTRNFFRFTPDSVTRRFVRESDVSPCPQHVGFGSERARWLSLSFSGFDSNRSLD